MKPERGPEELISAMTIHNRVKEMGQMITKDYQGERPILLGLLKGSFIFMADLCRSIDLDTDVDFMEVTSYGTQQTSSGIVRIVKDLTESITDRHVILVEDIIDTGLTLNHIIGSIQLKKPASLKVAALLVKYKKHNLQYPIEYMGFEIEDRFVVGYGMDASHHFRNLPWIGTLDSEQSVRG